MNSEDALMVLFMAVLYFLPNTSLSGIIFGLGSISLALYLEKFLSRNPHQSIWKRMYVYIKENAEDMCHVILVAAAVFPNTSTVQDWRILGIVIIAECLYRRIKISIIRDMQSLRKWRHSSSKMEEDTKPQSDRTLNDSERILLSELKCPVCMENMTPPIYLCMNGHNVCSTCKQKLDNCSTCRGSFTNIRNKSMENISRAYCEGK